MVMGSGHGSISPSLIIFDHDIIQRNRRVGDSGQTRKLVRTVKLDSFKRKFHKLMKDEVVMPRGYDG